MMTTRILQICGFLILTGGIAFYLYQRNMTPPETIKIYKAVKPNPQKATPMLTTQAEIEPANVRPAGEPPALNENSSLNEEDYEADVTSEPIQEGAGVTAYEATDVDGEGLSIPDEPLEAPDDPEAWVTEQLEIINASIEEKYPEIYALGTMTPEEIYERYPTEESRAQLAGLAQEVQSEFFGELRQLLSRLSSGLRAEFLMTLETQLSENWGTMRHEKWLRSSGPA